MPLDPATDDLWHHRYEDISAFERHLDRERTRVVKFFLHLSKEEQRQRLRLDDPHKNWKFNLADLDESAPCGRPTSTPTSRPSPPRRRRGRPGTCCPPTATTSPGFSPRR